MPFAHSDYALHFEQHQKMLLLAKEFKKPVTDLPSRTLKEKARAETVKSWQNDGNSVKMNAAHTD